MSVMKVARYAVVLFALAGCNFQLIPTAPNGALPQRAEVVILSPANGSTVALNGDLQLAARTYDPAGVALKIEFTADDTTVIGAIDQPEGSSVLLGSIAWRPTTARSYLITARATRPDGSEIGQNSITVTVVQVGSVTALAAVPSETPANIVQIPTVRSTLADATAQPTFTLRPTNAPTRVTAQPTNPTPTATDVPATVAPAVPSGMDDRPTLIVLARTINLRGGPGVAYGTIAAIPERERLIILGRNAERTWFIVERGDGTRGWITSSAQYVQVEGDATGVPLVANPPTPTATP